MSRFLRNFRAQQWAYLTLRNCVHCASHLQHCTDLFIVPQFYSILLSYIFYTYIQGRKYENRDRRYMDLKKPQVFMHLYENKHSIMSVCIKRYTPRLHLQGNIKVWYSWTSLSVKFVTLRYSIPIQTLQSPRPNPSSSHDCTSSNIIPVGWGHVAEPVRLNPNQFLSNGRRKVPNRIYARLIQSACGWGKDDCAIMSSLILFRQTGRQTGRPAQWGWSWRDAHCHQAWLDELSGKYHGCQRVS